MNYLTLSILFILLAIAWQDFKFRAVYWWLFPLLFATLACLKTLMVGLSIMFTALAYNLSFLVVQLCLLTLYFSFKVRRMVNIFKQLLGLGDLLFLICVAAYFSAYQFIAFYLLSLFVVMLLSLFIGYFSKDKQLKIPLAGEQALLMLSLLAITAIKPDLCLTADAWLLHHFVY